MNTIFMNWENSKTSHPHRVLLKSSNKIDFRRDEKSVALSNLSIYYTWKNIKISYNNNKFNISAPTWIIFYIRYSILFWVYLKKHGENTDNPSIKIYIYKIENSITFKIKIGYYLELLSPEAMKLLGSTENKINKNKNDENVSHL